MSRTLEKEWEDKLKEVKHIESEYEKILTSVPFTISRKQWNRIESLAHDIPALWKSDTTTNNQRKRLLRFFIEDVTLLNQDDPWGVSVKIHWKTGAVSQHTAERVKPFPHSTDPAVIDRIEQLYSNHTDREIANLLNKEGYRSGYGNAFSASSISHIRHRNEFKKHRFEKPKL